MVQVLFRYEPAHCEDILSLFDPQLPEIFRIVGDIRRGDAVVDHMAVFTSVFPDQHVVDHMRDHDDFVGEERACGLAQAECRFGRHAPFVPVVVRPVVGEYDFHSQQTGQRCQQCRAHRMDVDDVGFQAFGPHDGPERVDDCFERFFPRRFDVR